MMKRIFTITIFVLFGLSNKTFSQLPFDFIDQLVSDELAKPVGIKFDENGQAYIWEQEGRVMILDTSGVLLAEPLIDLREEVGGWWDHGLLGFALDPNFLDNGYYYLLYVVDRHHLIHFGTSSYNPDSSTYQQATIGRITRYQADGNSNFQKTTPNSRKVLIGDQIDNGFPIIIPSHGVGTLVFGTDGTLLASCGETGSFVSADAGSSSDTYYEQALEDGILKEKENVGAFRSQLIDNLNGKIIRIDPNTGEGISSNPFYDPAEPDAPRSKVWALGLRNPFRISLKPNSGSHDPALAKPGVVFAGDVGGSHWEELNIITEPALNFGWPIFEGMEIKTSFQNKIAFNLDAPNPLYEQNGCNKEYLKFHDLLIQSTLKTEDLFPNPCDEDQQLPASTPTFVHKRPAIAWQNDRLPIDSVAIVPTFDGAGNAISYGIEEVESGVEGIYFDGYSSISGVFYEGENYPEEYLNRYFQADFSGWIRVFDFDEDYHLTKVDSFHHDCKGIVDLAVSPKDGCIYYVKVNEGAAVRKICFGGDPPPVVIAKADVYYGVSPLTVSLDASESFHPKGYPITFEWDLGGGETNDEASFEYIFETQNSGPTPFPVTVTVTDSVGNSASETFIISLNNTPPVVEISSFEDGDLYPVSDFTLLPLKATVSDAEHDDSELTYAWQTFLFHNTHNHPNPIENAKFSSIIIEPLGCTDEDYWYRVELTVTDAAGLSTKVRSELFPYCGDLFGENVTLTGGAKQDGNHLSWTVTAENDIADYEIQRSTNITDYVTIGKIPAIGSNEYSYLDASPLFGNNRYRLKVVRNDGIYDYSNKVILKFPPDPDYSIYPNPASKILNVKVKESSGTIIFELFDATGKQIFYEEWADDTMDGVERPVEVGAHANGVYFFKLRNGFSTFHGSLLIMR